MSTKVWPTAKAVRTVGSNGNTLWRIKGAVYYWQPGAQLYRVTGDIANMNITAIGDARAYHTLSEAETALRRYVSKGRRR